MKHLKTIPGYVAALWSLVKAHPFTAIGCGLCLLALALVARPVLVALAAGAIWGGMFALFKAR